MPVATVLKKSLGIKEKKIVLAVSVAVGVLLLVGIGAFFFFNQQSARASLAEPTEFSTQVSETGEVQVFFQTQTVTTPVIKYGTSPDSLNEVAFGPSSSNHTIPLTGLEPNTTYYLQIEIDDQTFDNAGNPWTFTTGEFLSQADLISPVVVSPTSNPAPPVASVSATLITPSPATSSPTLIVSPTPTVVTSPGIFNTLRPATQSASLCPATTDCAQIIPQLGRTCSTQDYLKCLNSSSVTRPVTPTLTPTNTPTNTPTPIPQVVKNSCSVDFLQNNNSCRSWTWADVFQKNATCANVFSKYFVQCKSTSFSSDAPATWYCNETTTSNQLTLPCGSAPTPPPGGDVYCRVRAESPIGGNDHATEWVNATAKCPSISGDDPNCEINYIQANNCNSWIWDFDYQKDPRCKDKFDKYFFQCTNDGNFNSSSRWYCNQTTTNHYLDFPCFNAALPPDGGSVVCRVRAEDSFGELNQVSSWKTSTTAICPTSTPTPTNTPTATNTPTNTPTP